MDALHGFCGHCRTYPVGGSLNPTAFQRDAIRAVRGTTPARSLLAVVRLAARNGAPIDKIFDDLGPLWVATKITTEQRDVLRLMFTALRIVQEGRAALDDFVINDVPPTVYP